MTVGARPGAVEGGGTSAAKDAVPTADAAGRAVPDGYDERRDELLRLAAAAGGARGLTAIMTRVARLRLGRRAGEPGGAAGEPGGAAGVERGGAAGVERGGAAGVDPAIAEAVGFLEARRDCADFTLSGILRLLALDRQRPGLSLAERTALTRAVLDFTYWWDQPGGRGMCFHTENHQILFHSCELLASEAFGDETFTAAAGTGRDSAARATGLVERWLDLRERTGWSEWLSNTYVEHDVLALANLHDLAADGSLRRRAGALLDVLCVELASHSHRGVLGSTHGRAYAPGLRDGARSGTATLSWLLFGSGAPADVTSVGALAMASGGYRPPRLIERLHAGRPAPFTVHERQSFDVAHAPELGLGYTSELDGHAYWSMQEFGHPLVLPLTRRLMDRYGLGLDSDPADYEREYADQIAAHGQIVDPHRDRHALSAVDIATYRSPGAMLSCAQAYRPGSPGYQQHIWQATLGPRAVAFSTHPGSTDETSRPNFWAGNGVLPKAVLHDDVVMSLHRIPPEGALPFSHAYLPRAEFDEVIRVGPWWVARFEDGYLALWCSTGADEIDGEELRARAPDAAWVCLVGDGTTHRAGFAEFTADVAATMIDVDGLFVRVHRPSRAGRSGAVVPARTLAVGWDEPLWVDGRIVEVSGHPRYRSPFGEVPAGARHWRLDDGDLGLTIDLGPQDEPPNPVSDP
ncbi:hypothetical protein [Occultella gossypii]|uniref:Heparinase II/III-like protein n=1 Tax=Occultella gossypii TaxID=2800820 RepID=A0ABS7SEV0_9MICO|nr:hypothetical protein [Occultella gossypii]MBZ2197783.1 hypothetical protein [Occultella gossypii]